MGCDIHLHIEVKINGKWHHYAAPSVPRHYDLFEKMAGVRGSVENAIAPPRGLPADITELTQFCFEEEKENLGIHSTSYLVGDEIGLLEDWLRTQDGGRFGSLDLEVDVVRCYCFGNSFGGVAKYPDEVPRGVEQVRFVFWFDN